ncbi:formate dehydrogenase subunit gamma [Thalassospira sp.]|uniref:formate dehydrogenase subunit gamma n=1 Tax=Thalassospira sp. TaxID=1912094 RepID=UPI00273625CE|nr:formate dehydrogenase subunit gamma [Thalassospira sp.]MDP2699965.1 formate dehydrogenase subunit gamma [Thalassospira sp.]
MSLSQTVEEISTRVTAICDDLAGLEGPLLPILHEVQETWGFIPEGALQTIAKKLNLSRAEVHGVASFYHDFRHNAPGRHVIKICRAEACQAMGGDAIANQAQRKLGIGWSETTPDQSVTLEPVYCLGLCACAPAAMVDGKLVARLDNDRLDRMIKEVRS